MNYIELFILNILLIWGVNFAAYNVLQPITTRLFEFTAKHNITWITKPLYACKPCMSSIWGVTCFVFTPFEWWMYPIWVTALCGWSVVLTNFGK